MYHYKWPLHKKVQCFFSNDASKKEVTENKICEVTDCLNLALQSYMTSLWFMVASANCVDWGSNKGMTY